MIIAEYYRAYLVALRLGHDNIVNAITLEGEGRESMIYLEILSYVANGGALANIYEAAFVCAARLDHFLIMRALIAEGGVLLEEVGRTALTEAIRTNSISALITLLAQGVQPDQKSFQEATNYGNPRTLRILLRELWMTSDL